MHNLSELILETDAFFAWLKEAKGITKIELLDALEYYDEYCEYKETLK